MDARVSTTLRWLRAFVLAFVIMGTGVLAHVVADGRLPSAGGLFWLFTGTTLVIAMLLGRPASTLRVVVLTVGGQAAVHAVLTMSAGHAGDPVAAASPRPTPRAFDPNAAGTLYEQYDRTRPQVDAQLAIPDGVVHLFGDLTGPHAPMMVVHMLAAALVGLWLAVGERALWTLLALAVTVVVPTLRTQLVSLAAPAPHRSVTHAVATPRFLLVLSRSLARRGPPVLLPA
ncbi:MAG: hypothetical protein L0H93_05645 [Nocardioides sp.]|nr:hypothetical protein [Nocardioides sp.]